MNNNFNTQYAKPTMHPSMFEDNVNNSQTDNFKKTAISNKIENNKISNIYFSRVNIDALQQGIRYLVWKNSKNKYVIGKQSEVQLQVIMRSIYFQYSKNLDYDILAQVKELNQKILDYVVPNIIIEIEQYNYYIKDISALPVPLERSKNVSSAGTKFLYTAEL